MERSGVIRGFWLLLLFAGAACTSGVFGPQANLDAGAQDGGANPSTIGRPCQSQDDCSEGWCSYATDAGCGAQMQCLRPRGPDDVLRCGCSGRDLLTGATASEPIAHEGSCQGPEVNCDFANGERHTLSRIANPDCLKTPCPAGYICEIVGERSGDEPYTATCYRAPARCGERPSCDCISPCACRDICMDTDGGPVCDLVFKPTP